MKISGPQAAIDFANRLQLAVSRAGVEGRDIASQLSDATGINRITLGSWLRGERKARFENCEVLADVLDVDPRWLYSGKVKQPTQTIMDRRKLWGLDNYEDRPF